MTRRKEQAVAYLCLEAPREGQASFVHVHEIIAGLVRRGWRVDLFTPSYSHAWQRPSALVRLLHYSFLQVRLALNLRRYDVLYIRAHPLAFPASLLARAMRIPVVHEVNGLYEDLYLAYPGARKFRALLDWMQRVQYRAATVLIAVTDYLAQWLRKEAGRMEPQIEVVPNGANIDLFKPNASTLRRLPETFVVFAGGLTAWHGVDVMMQAAADPAWPKDVSLVIVGDGPEMSKIKQAASGNRLILPLGRLPYPEVPGIVAKALAGLVPIGDPGNRSSRGGLAPLKLYETLACGVPVVASDFSGQADLVRSAQCGLLFPSGDGKALAEAVAWLAGNREASLRMGERGAKLVHREHSWDRRADDTDKILRSVS